MGKVVLCTYQVKLRDRTPGKDMSPVTDKRTIKVYRGWVRKALSVGAGAAVGLALYGVLRDRRAQWLALPALLATTYLTHRRLEYLDRPCYTFRGANVRFLEGGLAIDALPTRKFSQLSIDCGIYRYFSIEQALNQIGDDVRPGKVEVYYNWRVSQQPIWINGVNRKPFSGSTGCANTTVEDTFIVDWVWKNKAGT